ncbi:MAG TPA: Na+/H+ antiporter subunit E [Acidimicrobiales bacterium]|nr:Na+/H+ antiporter subunit E [Acidimicrobiales bacterium]
MAVWLARILEVVFWWAACLGVWLVSLSAISGQELLVAVLLSFPCGVLALVGRLAASNKWELKASWLRGAAVLPLAIVNDAFQVLFQVLRSPRQRGRFVKVSIAGGVGHGPRADGRRALSTILTTMTPSSVVTDIDPDTGEALVHLIPIRGPHMEKAATR